MWLALYGITGWTRLVYNITRKKKMETEQELTKTIRNHVRCRPIEMPLTEVGGWMRIEMDGDAALLHVQTNTGSTKYKITKQAIYSIFALR